jgi:membrane protein implicated in regulation of membrane protease activity
MSALQRYVLFQIPGWIVAGVILAGCWELELITGRTGVILLALLFVKDVVAYPLVRRAYEHRSGTRTNEMIGRSGVVQRELAPVGFVRIRGELWRAELIGSMPALPVGATVVVRNTRGLTLLVEESETE